MATQRTTRRPDPAVPDLRLRLDIGYDGTEFAGWARQPGERTVQAELSTALAAILHVDGHLYAACAGRTDAGVHARGQVAHVDVPFDKWHAVAKKVPFRLRGTLPPDIRVTAVREAEPGFDARYSALSRRYSYTLCDSTTGPDPLARMWAVRHPNTLDVDRMNAAVPQLLGLHDFAAFCKQADGRTSIRTLLDANWSRNGEIVTLSITADAFCHSMVRSLVGGFLPVGDGRRQPEWMGEVLHAGERHNAANVAPAQGLVLEEVVYPPADQFLARQAITRAIRQL